MSGPAAWQDANTAFLERLVAAVREHLGALADPDAHAAEALLAAGVG